MTARSREMIVRPLCDASKTLRKFRYLESKSRELQLILNWHGNRSKWPYPS